LETQTLRIVEGQYLLDILDQPRAMAATLESLEIPKQLEAAGQWSRDAKRIVLTGMGASFHALYPLFLRLNARGFTAVMIETSELVHSLGRWLEPETLIIGVSQSGQSAEIVRLLEENKTNEKKRGAMVVGVTNAADSALALGANASILTMAGKEFSVSCKTYVTALMALHLLGGFLCGCDERQSRAELAQATDAVGCYLDRWKDHVYEIADGVGRVRNLFLLGRGDSLAASGAGALIIKESVRLHAEGMSGAAFRHGPLEMVDDETFAVVFAGAESTRALQSRLVKDIREAGGRVGWISGRATGENARPEQAKALQANSGAWNLMATPASVRPMLEILPVQMMTLALAAEAGIEAGRFGRVSKITTTE
jgi:glutamine---fructose-6-phosphate transaminase (isomerizing)